MGCLYIISLTILSYITVSESQVVLTPEDVYLATNGSGTLSCSREGSWLFGDTTQLTSVQNGERGLRLSESELRIDGFQPSLHAGQYHCVSTVNGATMVSCPAMVHHAYIQARPFRVNPANTTVRVNSTAVLACEAPPSSPVPLYRWTRNGRPLDAGDPRLVVLPTGNLNIGRAQESDAGEYQCIAENPVTGARRRSSTAFLSVSSTPSPTYVITATPHSLTRAVGDTAVYVCTVSGPSHLPVRWEKLHSRSFPTTAKVPLSLGVLEIDPVTGDESGVYRCLAVIDEQGNKIFVDVELEVKGPPTYTHSPPESVTMETGHTPLTWTLQDSGPVRAQLFHEGQLLDTMSTSAAGELTLSHAPTGEGLYQCLALGAFGCASSTVVVSMATSTTESTPTTNSTPETTPTAIVETAFSTNETTPTASPTTETTPTASPTTEATPTTHPQTAPLTTDPVSTTNEDKQTTPTQPPVDTTQLPEEHLVVLPEVAVLTTSGPLQLICTASHLSVTPTLMWTDPSGQMVSDGTMVSNSKRVDLTVNVTEPGVYSCEGRWSGVGAQTTTIIVHPAPLAVSVGESVRTALVGEGVELVCVGAGSGAEVEWVRDSRSLGMGTVTRENHALLRSKFIINAVTLSHAGDYVCRVSSAYFLESKEASVTLTVKEPPRPPIGPPVKVGVVPSPNGGVVISWDPPQTEEVLLGYKINVGKEPVSQIALYSTGPDERTFFVFPSIFTEHGDQVTVIVWAYSQDREGVPDSVVVSPLGPTVPPEPAIGPPVIVGVVPSPNGGVVISWDPPQTEEVLLGYKINVGKEPVSQIALYSTGPDERRFFVFPSIFTEHSDQVTVIVWAYNQDGDGVPGKVVVSPLGPTVTTGPTVSSCSAVLIAPLTATLRLTGHAPSILTYTCTEAQVTHAVDITMATDQQYIVKGLLPSCTYTFHVTYADGALESCDLVTPQSELNVSASVVRHPNGSVSLRWVLPRPLLSVDRLTVEINWGSGWVAVLPGQHLPLDHTQDHRVELRFRSGEWEGVTSVDIPAVSMETTSGKDPTEIALIYGVIFGGLLVLIVAVLLVILSLKYIQMTRRETDKESDEKEKERDHFRRMSMERVSRNSIKRPANYMDSKDHTYI